MIALNNKWEELRSALEYYKYITVSDEEDIIYQTNGILKPLLVGERYSIWQHIQFRRDIFHTRTIHINNGDVRRINIIDDNGDMEIYEVITEDGERLVLSLWGVKENPEDLIQFNGKITISDLVNPKAWNKDMCFYNEETDTAALGVDMLRYDIKSSYKKYKYNGKIDYKDGLTDLLSLFTTKVSRRIEFDFMAYNMENDDNFVPAFIIEHYPTNGERYSEIGKHIYMDVINAYTGERLTYRKVKPELTEAEIKEIHSFATDMKAAYKRLLEPQRDY